MNTENNDWVEIEQFKDRVETINYNNRRFDLLSTALPTSAITLLGAGMRVFSVEPWVVDLKLPHLIFSASILILLSNYLSYFFATSVGTLDHDLTLNEEKITEKENEKLLKLSLIVKRLNQTSTILMIVLSSLLILVGLGVSRDV